MAESRRAGKLDIGKVPIPCQRNEPVRRDYHAA